MGIHSQKPTLYKEMTDIVRRPLGGSTFCFRIIIFFTISSAFKASFYWSVLFFFFSF